jgi:P-type conjugative transfer protein TrbJ
MPKTSLWLSSVAAGALALTAVAPATPAHAQLTVIDPTNLVQNLLQVKHAIEQVTLLTSQLEAQARMLASSPFDQANEIRAALDDINGLVSEIRGISAEAGRLRDQLESLYPGDLSGKTLMDMVTDAQSRVEATRDTVADSLAIAAEIESRRGDRAGRMGGALAASRSAEGQTGAIQATNQAIGALSEQLESLEALMAAQTRMAGAEAAARAAREAQSREVHDRNWSRPAGEVPPPNFDPLPNARR